MGSVGLLYVGAILFLNGVSEVSLPTGDGLIRGGSMVAYEYRCEHHGVFMVHHPMGHAKDTSACVTCQEDAARIYSTPMLRRAPADRVAIIDKAEKSRDEPEVVSSLPPRHPSKRTPTAPPSPVLQRLPRP